jgi:hypothetical protein
MRRRSRFGLTILEVVVLVAAAVLLFTLLITAVTHAREASRRTACRNNLKALGLALHDYHEAHKVFPPGVVAQNFTRNDADVIGEFVAQKAFCDEPTISQASGLTLLLPFLDERRIYEQYNLSLAACSLQNETSVGRVVKAYVCPSNPRQGKFVQEYYLGADTGGVGPTDYVFSVGGYGLPSNYNALAGIGGHGPRGRPFVMISSCGVFGVNSSTRIDAIKDGLSSTIAMGESVGGLPLAVPPVGTGHDRLQANEKVQEWDKALVADQGWSQGHIPGSAGGYGAVFGATAWNAWFSTNRDLTDPSLWIPIRLNEGGSKAARPTWVTPSGPVWTLMGVDGTALPGDQGSMQGFRSVHVNSVHFLMVDGSVRAIHDDVDPWLLVALSTVIGREELPKDWQ